jgi:hypothetical protein
LGDYSDDFENMSRAAVAGGITTVLPFVFASGAKPPARYIREYKGFAEREAWTDFGFHFGITKSADIDAIPAVVKMGVRSFKALMAYKTQGSMINDKLLARAMEEIGRWRGIMMVHAEDGELIDALEQRAKAADLRSPPDYARCLVERLDPLDHVSQPDRYHAHRQKRRVIENGPGFQSFDLFWNRSASRTAILAHPACPIIYLIGCVVWSKSRY